MRKRQRRIAVAAVLAIFGCLPSSAQSTAPTPAFRVDSPLTLIDVIAEQVGPGGGPEFVASLHRGDFSIHDNGHEVSIQSFAGGARDRTRPIALWLIVECNQSYRTGKATIAATSEYHSMFLRGKADLLKPVLKRLNAEDTIGVAHWCSNGNTSVDMMPIHDPDTALAKVKEILNQKPVFEGGMMGSARPIQHLIPLIIRISRRTWGLAVRSQGPPARLPVLLFLSGDQNVEAFGQANSFLKYLFRQPVVVFGLNCGAPYAPPDAFPLISTEVDPQERQIHYLAHFYSRETGGNFYSVNDPKLLSAALDYILAQLHFRYTIGLKPKTVDGKRHTLNVELTAEVRKRFPAAQLRYRPEYIPIVSSKSGP